MTLTSVDHVQLAIPPGGEDRARAFYVGVLGLTELPKPAGLAARGGAWFTSGPINLHLGVDPEFRPTVKAHTPHFRSRISARSRSVHARSASRSRATSRCPASRAFSCTIRSATGSS